MERENRLCSLAPLVFIFVVNKYKSSHAVDYHGGGSGYRLDGGEGFAAKGAAVALCDVDESLLDNLPDDFHGFCADVADQKRMEAFMDSAISRLGGVDVLINNAGTGGAARAG